MSGEGIAGAPVENLSAEAMLAASGEKLNELQAQLDRQADILGGFQSMRDVLIDGAVKLGLLTGAGEADQGNAELANLVIAALGDAKAKIADLEKLAAQPKAAPKAKASGGKADKIGPVSALSDEARRELDMALEAGAPFTIVPSDGKHALRELERTEISGEAWRRDGTRMRLNLPLVLTPQGRCTVAGFGLVDAAGKQVAWCPLPEPVPLAAGSETSFRDSIHF